MPQESYQRIKEPYPVEPEVKEPETPEGYWLSNFIRRAISFLYGYDGSQNRRIKCSSDGALNVNLSEQNRLYRNAGGFLTIEKCISVGVTNFYTSSAGVTKNIPSSADYGLFWTLDYTVEIYITSPVWIHFWLNPYMAARVDVSGASQLIGYTRDAGGDGYVNIQWIKERT